MGAGKDMAIPDAMLQRDAPPPARLAGTGPRIRRQRAAAGRRKCNRAIARQPMLPVAEGHAQRLAKQERTEPRTVDEEIAFDAASVSQRDSADMPALRVLLDR